MDFIIPDYAKKVLYRLEEAGYEAFIVGGCVRDLILGRVPHDYDIATNARPEEVEGVFSDLKTIDVGRDFGTIVVVMEDYPIEVTTYRLEGQYIDGRRPSEVSFSSRIEEDLSRRDFTINSMAYNESYGLVDPFGGRLDLERGLIRTVGDPRERFKEDHLRILRGIRFATELGFEMEYSTYMGSKEMSQLLSSISAERIREEFFKLILSPGASKGIRLMVDLGVLDLILPELKATMGFDQQNPHHDKDIFDHSLCVVDRLPSELDLRLAGLLHDIGKPASFTIDDKGIGHFYGHEDLGAEMAKEILTRLKCPKDLIRRVVLLVDNHMAKSMDMKDKGIKKLIAKVGEDLIFRLMDLQKADKECTNNLADASFIDERIQDVIRILESNQVYEKNQLEIDGYDIINLGYKQGKLIGDILDYLLEIVLINPELNEKERLIDIVRENF